MGCHALLQKVLPAQGSNPSVTSPALVGGFFTISTSWENLLYCSNRSHQPLLAQGGLRASGPGVISGTVWLRQQDPGSRSRCPGPWCCLHITHFSFAGSRQPSCPVPLTVPRHSWLFQQCSLQHRLPAPSPRWSHERFGNPEGPMVS